MPQTIEQLLNTDIYEKVVNSDCIKLIILNDDENLQLKKICSVSTYAADQLSKSPEIFADWISQQRESKSLNFSIIKADFEGVAFNELLLKKRLRYWRHYFMVQIILNDTCAQTPLKTILYQVSYLADLLIQVALQIASTELEAKHGIPLNSDGERQQLMVIGMGKLGGGELNFSSDIDLIYVYAEEGSLDGLGHLSYREFFIRVGRLLAKLLNDVTADGFVYRVDLRLRPWGDSGPLVITLAGLENYYHLNGRDWERYALVKARVITGAESDKKKLQDVISPFVYRKYHDFNVFSGLGSLKKQIDIEARKKQQKNNIKLGLGGIREIEFSIQALQILQGGRRKQLQVQSIMTMFEVAKSETFYTSDELAILEESYHLFRIVENRIQMIADQQTHTLPDSEEGQQRMILSLPFDSWDELMQAVNAAKEKVNVIFNQLFSEQLDPEEVVVDFSLYNEQQWLDYAEQYGFSGEKSFAEEMSRFFGERTIVYMSKNGRDRLFQLLPALLTEVYKNKDSSALLSKITNLLSAIAGRSVYLELMSRYQPMLSKLIDLFAKSDWLADEIIHYPILLESVLIPQEDSIFKKSDLIRALNRELEHVGGDVELELDVLRVFKRQQMFQIALKEIEGKIPALEASRYLSELAAVMLQASYELNWTVLVKNYGEPEYRLDGKKHQAKMGVIAYGKLGGQELHYSSDLDVIFLHNSKGSKQLTNGKKQLDNGTFFARLAQKIIASLSLLTSSGRMYEIDARLRPNGASGYLVTAMDAYQTYQLTKAWVWEHQALVRAVYVAGDEVIAAEFQAAKCHILSLQHDRENLAEEVQDMREKMYQAKVKESQASTRFNIKQGRGGLVDIEFMVQYLVLRHANKISSLCQYSDNITMIEQLIENQCVVPEFKQLTEIYIKLHQYLHQQVLLTHYEIDCNDELTNNIELVRSHWKQCFAD